MIDREKLIELLDAIQQRGEDFTDYEIYGMRLPNTVCNDDVAAHLIANGVTVPVHCKDCKHWLHMEGGMGDCTNGRFHLDGHADPTMKADDFCSCGERRGND